jgi:branched-chain amino acid transport system permease protein
MKATIKILRQQADFFTRHKDFSFTIVTVIVIFFTPFVLKNDYYIHIGCMVGVNILMALGMHMVTGLAGQINMGQYGYYCIGAYSGALLTTNLQLPFEAALPCTIVISIIFGLLVGIPSLKVEGPYLALCTIGFAESVRLIINGADWANRAEGISSIPKLSILGFVMNTKLKSYFFIMAVVLVCIVCVNNIMNSNFGRRFKAIKDDPLAASVLGINVTSIKLLAFAACAVLGGIGGNLYANYAGYVNPLTFIQAMQVNFLLMIVLGGLGSSWGSIIGAVLVTVVFEYTRAYAEFQRIAFGVIMVLIVLFLRRGLVGTIAYHIQEKKIQKHHNEAEGEEKL